MQISLHNIVFMEILFATANPNKIREASQILGPFFSIITPKDLNILEDIPENGTTISENAVMKAEYIQKVTGRICFADDTGLEVDALDGAPGVYSARYASQICDPQKNMQKLLCELNGIDNRKARFITIIAYIDSNEIHLFEGVLNGKIIDTPLGDKGFGYDPIFVPDGYEMTLAQLPPLEKNFISHRGIALRKLSQFLKEAYHQPQS